MQPHRSRYWLNAKPDERKDERIADLCALYQDAPNRPDELVISTDEMTGIQALERIAADLPMSCGKPLAMEFEYQRHGTQTLIAAIDVTTGCAWASCGNTRTEEDFARFIEWVITQNPGYRVGLPRCARPAQHAQVRDAGAHYRAAVRLGPRSRRERQERNPPVDGHA